MDSGQASIFIVNRSLTDDLEVEVRMLDTSVKRVLGVEMLTGDDPMAHNTWERPDVVRPVAGTATLVDGNVRLVAPSLGLAVVRMALERR